MIQPSRAMLPTLLLLSGFCGISYEILYAKLLGNLLGNRFTISASVLLTFLLGIGLGTLYAHRFLRRLWVIEAGIGLYAAAIALTYGWIDQLIYSGLPRLGTSIVACAAVSILLLAVPAFLVGCSVPLFAAYLGAVRSKFVFSATYGIYNFGAALTALAMEFVVLRLIGLKAATLCLALLNVVVALALLALVRRYPLIQSPPKDRLHFAPRDVTALVLASIGSAVFQLLMIKVAECFIGPFNETFSLVLTVVLLGIAVGSIAAGRGGLSFGGAMILSLSGIAALLGLQGAIAEAFAALRPEVVQSYALLTALKFGLVLVLMGLPSVGFGATIPALLRAHRDVARESGQLLFASSMGNVAGFLLMAFVLHRYLDYGPTLLVVAALAGAALWLHAGRTRVTACAGLALLVLASVARTTTWSEQLLYYGHVNFYSREKLRAVRGSDFLADRFKGPQDVFAITWKNGSPSFFINGYISIPLTAVAEKVAGALSVMASPRTDRALVLGVGSGATAGTVGLMFEHTDAVEINAVILQNLHRMAEYNFDLEHLPGVTIHHDDGIHFVKSAGERYSLIVNTVTTPIYFSSSKLYTRDFLEDVVERLEPDGVYTTWVDRDIGDRGVDIIVETLAEVFDHCWLNYLKSSYYLLICSDAEIGLHQVATVAGNPTLAGYLATQEELLSRMVPYSLLTTDLFALRPAAGAPVNTLDFPVLEHEMARLQLNKLFRFNDRLERHLDLAAVGATLAPVMAWDPAETLVWADLRLRSGSTLERVLDDAAEAWFGDVAEPYGKAALVAAEELGTADAFYRYGYRMFKRKAYRHAIRAYTRVTEIEPDNARALYYVGMSHEALGEPDLAREAYAGSLRIDPTDTEVSERLAGLPAPASP